GPAIGAGALLGVVLAGDAGAGLPRARSRRAAAATGFGPVRARETAARRRRRAPPAWLPAWRPAAHHRMEAIRAARHAAGEGVRATAGRDAGTGLAVTARHAARGAHPSSRALGRRRRTRRQALPPGGPRCRTGTGARAGASPCLPAYAGIDAGRRRQRGSRLMSSPGTPALDQRTRAWCLAAAAACVLPLLLQVPPTLALVIISVAVVGAALSWRRPLPVVVRVLLAGSLVMLVLATMQFSFGRDTACALLRSEEHTSELQSRENLVCRLLHEKKKLLNNKHYI